MWMKLCCVGAIVVVSGVSGLTFEPSPEPPEEWYDYRQTPQFEALTADEKAGLEQVTRDFVLLRGALEMYCDDHQDQPPESLDDLVPRYLRELPRDAFATAETASLTEPIGYVPSREGWGYRYRHGSPGNRAWIICSVGLPDFPYLSSKGNIGLYRCKGAWISGVNPARYQPRSGS